MTRLILAAIILLTSCGESTTESPKPGTTIACPAGSESTWCLGFRDGSTAGIEMQPSAGGFVDGTLKTGEVELPLRGTRANGNYRMHLCADNPAGVLHGRFIWPQRAEVTAPVTIEVDTQNELFQHAVTAYEQGALPKAVTSPTPPALTGRWSLFAKDVTPETMFIAQHDNMLFIVPVGEKGAVSGEGIGHCRGFLGLLESPREFTTPTGYEDTRANGLHVWGEFSDDATWGTLTRAYTELSGYWYRESFAFKRLD